MESRNKIDLLVIGGGAAGYMGAIKAAEDGVRYVTILELSTKPLEKVRISGGGRCNVTHACWDSSELIPNYPRGQIPLIGAFNRFAAGDAVDWFEKRGLKLTIEEDGRLFPQSNSSIEVVNCLQKAASRAGVVSLTKKSVIDVKDLYEDGYLISCSDGSLFYSKTVLLATGGYPSGKKLALKLGHKLVPAVPSLFSFRLNTNSNWLISTAGISVDNVKIKLLTSKKVFKEEGRLLITHKGLSGPVIFKLSAFAARKLSEDKYSATLEINWLNITNELSKDLLTKFRNNYPNRNLNSINPFATIPKRLWTYFLIQNDINPQKKWCSISKKEVNRLSNFLERNSHSIIAKGPYGEEFVTAGGVCLEEIDFQAMRSKLSRGLFFAGEILDIDGITGGFNFQHCWTSGWISGRAIAKELSV